MGDHALDLGYGDSPTTDWNGVTNDLSSSTREKNVHLGQLVLVPLRSFSDSDEELAQDSFWWSLRRQLHFSAITTLESLVLEVKSSTERTSLVHLADIRLHLQPLRNDRLLPLHRWFIRGWLQDG